MGKNGRLIYVRSSGSCPIAGSNINDDIDNSHIITRESIITVIYESKLNQSIDHSSPLITVALSCHAQDREEAILFRETEPHNRQSPLWLKKDCQQTFYFGLAVAYIPCGVSLKNNIRSLHAWPAAPAARGGGSILWFILRRCQCIKYIESNDRIHGWRIRKNLEGSGHGPGIWQKVLRKAKKRLNHDGRSESSTSRNTYIYIYIYIYILSRVWVTTDGVWIGNLIYWTLTDRNYK
jgi:hypothetical protein